TYQLLGYGLVFLNSVAVLQTYRKSQPSHLSCSSGVSNVKRPCSKQKFVYNRPKPDTLQSILRSKANPEYNSRRLWYELNMPECTSEILDGRMLSTSIPDRLLCHTKEMRCKRRIQTKKKEKRPSYMQMRLERENFRKKLVELIARKDDDDDVVNATAGGSPANAIDLEAEFPNKEEKEVLRYYYYIKHGIDTIHVSPMSKKVLNRIKSQIPAVLNKWATALNENIVEIKSDYVFAMKKAVIDFVLQNSLINLKKDAQLELTAERKEANRMFNRWRYRVLYSAVPNLKYSPPATSML
ncbi:axonemal, Dynein heavy chain 7, partial [Lucilia cuprina]